MSPTTWRNNFARRRKRRVSTALPEKPSKEAPENTPDLSSTSQTEKRSSGADIHDAAQETSHGSERIPQGPSQSQSGDSVTDVDAETSPWQTVPDDASIFVSESEDGSSMHKIKTPGTQDLKQAKVWSDERHLVDSSGDESGRLREADNSRQEVPESASSSAQLAKLDEARHDEGYFKGKTLEQGGDTRFDEWVAAKLRESQRSESECAEAENCVREEAPAGQLQAAEPVHQPKPRKRTDPEIASTEPVQPTEPERYMKSPRALEEEQVPVHEQDAEAERHAESQPLTETELDAKPEKQQDSANGTEGSRQEQNASAPERSKRSKSSFDWAELSGDDDPEIGFSEWKERNLPGYQTQSRPRSEAAGKPEKPKETAREHYAFVPQPQPAKPKALVKTKQKPAKSPKSIAAPTETITAEAASDTAPKKMLWSQIVRGSSTKSRTPAKAQSGSGSVSMSGQKKSATPWRRVQAHQPPSGQEEDFPALTAKEKGKRVDRKTWRRVQSSEQASVSTGKAKGKQPEPVNPFHALEPLVERVASTANAGSPKEESDWERDWESGHEGEGESSKRAAAREPAWMRQAAKDTEAKEQASPLGPGELVGEKSQEMASHDEGDSFRTAPAQEHGIAQQETESETTRGIAAPGYRSVKKPRGKKGSKKEKRQPKHRTPAETARPSPSATTVLTGDPSMPHSPTPLSPNPSECSSTSTLGRANPSILTPLGSPKHPTGAKDEFTETHAPPGSPSPPPPPLSSPLPLGDGKPAPTQPRTTKQRRRMLRRQRQEQEQREQQQKPSSPTPDVPVRLSNTSISDVVMGRTSMMDLLRVGPVARMPLPLPLPSARADGDADDRSRGGDVPGPAYRWTPPRYARYEELEKMIAQQGVAEEAVFDMELAEKSDNDDESDEGDGNDDDKNDDDSDDDDDDGHGHDDGEDGHGHDDQGGEEDEEDDDGGDEGGDDETQEEAADDDAVRASQILLQIQRRVANFVPADLDMTGEQWMRRVGEAWFGSDVGDKAKE
ncbi:hypothetical protein MYCTH_2307099 [Thermothelomyces thermophilus ATCC 42464]|uniref:Uncharacterized protein n=1 Tax=Thermothelomyces thermophilus (strain ATCC 42464 / BCRC 31852 / DSM 1799) TaxID=573729 RepID=G2QF82_THET4|nr:uncharacterized protein MYCTH_2307099 [Thermothelomyces thermophilus ATCC 42464]AEO59111.1 hypothetical protein MYCTH_2307099 [Thermothelomyces thermophilus ATCC 42464]